MGNVYAAQSMSKPSPSSSLPPSPPMGLAPLPAVETKESLPPVLIKESECPGTVEDLHKKCKEVFPAAFEGAKFILNKGVSNHFQISHVLQMGSPATSFYRFGATYVGMQQVSSTEAYPVILGDIDPNGNMNANVLLQLHKKLRFKFQAQSQNSKFQLTQYTLDYKGSNHSATMMLANIDALRMTGVGVGHYLQSVSKNLDLGAEVVVQKIGPETPFGGGGGGGGGMNASLFASLVARYHGADCIYSGTLGMTGLHLCYYQKASDQLQVGVEFETSLRMKEAQASIGYQVDIPKADLVFRGSVDSNWTVSGVLEKRLAPMPFTMSISGSMNHRKNDFKLGFGFIIG